MKVTVETCVGDIRVYLGVDLTSYTYARNSLTFYDPKTVVEHLNPSRHRNSAVRAQNKRAVKELNEAVIEEYRELYKQANER